MSKFNLAVFLALVLLAIAGGGLFWSSLQPAELPPPPQTKSLETAREAGRALPKVVTLYQKGEGESDLAVFVGKELAAKSRGLAAFSMVDTSDEPQMLEYYGVSSVPTVIFITPAGKVYKVHEGYLDKAAILGTLKLMK